MRLIAAPAEDGNLPSPTARFEVQHPTQMLGPRTLCSPPTLPRARAPEPGFSSTALEEGVPPNCGKIGSVDPVGLPPDPPAVLTPNPSVPKSVGPVATPPDPPAELDP